MVECKETPLNRKAVLCVLFMVAFNSTPLHCQLVSAEHSELPSIQRIAPPSGTASAEDLERRGDELRMQKEYAYAIDYYRAALAKKAGSAELYNKIGLSELLAQRLTAAQNAFEKALKLDGRFAAAYNNLGVVEYMRKKYGQAAKQYEKAITLQPEIASYNSNLGAAYFSKKDWNKSMEAYSRAIAIDPGVFDADSRIGVTGKVSSPEDRAHFSFALAKLYAKNGLPDRSLEYLRRAMEEGYKGIGEVYKDSEFAELRKDPRFTELMASPPFSIPE